MLIITVNATLFQESPNTHTNANYPKLFSAGHQSLYCLKKGWVFTVFGSGARKASPVVAMWAPRVFYFTSSICSWFFGYSGFLLEVSHKGWPISPVLPPAPASKLFQVEINWGPGKFINNYTTFLGELRNSMAGKALAYMQLTSIQSSALHLVPWALQRVIAETEPGLSPEHYQVGLPNKKKELK